ncbi:NADH dehydrogenase subunit 6 (mitochondrion) [Spodoptera litura]|uniref:NADH-ubiquinone oxidoreductase chain 6 n=1 Tax=Spodoptera litura TaxID=69820 RepID=U5HSI5_SPOLT|nr:NADH dehydrogenase subunit 6 [Spodoptera litura]AFC77919.1 NADH dehydrogenase subunit 6 [Spodoptera litura]AGZ13030.1 NADH dehydrogenase subunit 6 [Spodoptera litura]AHA84874.1 NADH dehydrogenase subunit 6 [Spodoptera litura]QTZ20323.1 NADH dehydrogenase subunit 6 [Spodoptera litura]UDP55398.1 NADH dehydrogenase subunit 6 [Spodoptera litura]
MMKMFFSLMLMMNSLFMLFINNPMSMGLLILSQTLLTCLLSGMMIKTYWFSYILFLTFLGGLLVLFIYVSSIASNQLFNFKFNYKKMLTLLLIMMFFMLMMYNNNMTWMNLSMNSDMNKFYDMYMFINNENKINLSKLYNNQTFLIMMMLVIYLFITLIAIVKITNIFYGPLRSSN